MDIVWQSYERPDGLARVGTEFAAIELAVTRLPLGQWLEGVSAERAIVHLGLHFRS